ncbi:hypothetical protein JZ751_010559 [Albula glossodonta]|uniref:Uncharacterized protein n=1 Tax=Albula glossodonta TaxID=121402 RepID=A0A8T2P5M6_9TELE|nr:hypothetical protein JZ751_010559 [Albula glossodonta]
MVAPLTASVFHVSNIRGTALDLSQPLEEQGPLDIIVHKLTDLILEADQNDTQALLLVQRVQLCKPEGSKEFSLPPFLSADDRICSPPFMVLNSEYGPDTLRQIEKHGITFPFICKTRVAHGTNSHEVSLKPER